MILKAVNLSKSFRTRSRRGGKAEIRAVDGVSLELGAGETLAVVGESGSGKSTLARMLLHLIPPDDGSVVFDGIALNDLSGRQLRALRAKMQMIFQDPYTSLDPKMVIGAQVMEPLKVHNVCADRRARRVKAIELLETVGLRADQFDRYPYEFSGGQLQRVTIARALATSPKLLVCDEPVAALDVSIRAQVINLLNQIQRDFGISLLFISHDLSLVGHIADRVAVMHHGKILEQGVTASVYSDPQSEYTQELLRAIPIPDPSVSRRWASVETTAADTAVSEPESRKMVDAHALESGGL